VSRWPSAKARRVLAALLRLGWIVKRQSGSHRTPAHAGSPDFVFAFHDDDEIGQHHSRHGVMRRTQPVRREVEGMTREYDFSTARRNAYAIRLKQPVTIRLDAAAVVYFKELATETGIT
jgi:predicted RNA binding protein YcfA (HicA-like mRNA interferase family)